MDQSGTFFLFVLVLFFSNCQKEEESAIDLSSFQIQEGFKIELVASEPLVTDPVAMEIDENGRMYVVEMPGYPLDITGTGRIKILQDTDEDGLLDQSIMFAEGLILPNGIMRWKNGVIVSDAPDVIYLEDTDGDSKADKREILLTGFSRSNPQHNMNTPKYGLDNWIYLGHEGAFITKTFENEFGGRGEEIHFPNQIGAPSLPQNANNRSVRFQPDQKRLEMLSGQTQFGYSFDNWGHIFYTSNATHLFHEVIAARYLQGQENLPISSTRKYLPEYGPGAEIFPITENPEHQILTDVGTITSSCGLTFYQGGSFPEAYNQISFIAEPVHNLIHTDKIQEQGASYTANRQLENKEFLASKDSWFRPVNFYIGPEGNLYVLDYHRQYIEHPEWMATEVVASGQLYNGKDKGRIYKISPKEEQRYATSAKPNLGELSDEALIPYLAHANIWWRKHAQRLLVQHGKLKTKQALIDFARSTPSSLGLLHAMWALEGLNLFDLEVWQKALSHSVPGLRENAIKIAELHLDQQPELLPYLMALGNDADPKVRFQLLCTLSLLHSDETRSIIESILWQDIEDEWVQIMALAGSAKREVALLTSIVEQAKNNPSDGARSFVAKASQMIGRNGKEEAIKSLIRTTIRRKKTDQNWEYPAILKGLAAGMGSRSGWGKEFEAERDLLLKYFDESIPKEIRKRALALLKVLGLPTDGRQSKIDLALLILSNTRSDPDLKIDATRLLALDQAEKYVVQFTGLINPKESIDVQKTALNALNSVAYQQFKLDTFVFNHWESITPELHAEAIALLMKREETVKGLLAAVESGKLHKSNIPWSQTFRLLNHRNDEIKAKARILLAGEEQITDEILIQYQAALEGTGHIETGKQVFSRVCRSCHQIAGADGINFGPDLATIRNRSKKAILNDIIFPNLAIADGYEIWEVIFTDGTKKLGIIAEEVNENIVLSEPSGTRIIIARRKIATIKPLETSGMPEGLHQQLSVEEMQDLLSFLKRPY